MDLGSVFKKLIEAGYQQQNVKVSDGPGLKLELSTPDINHLCFAVCICRKSRIRLILIMTFWLCFAKHQSTKSPLVATFYKDGLFYFLLLSAVSTGNIICNLVAPLPYIYLLAIPQMVLHSALSTRMVLHIRKLGNGVYDTKGEIPLTSLDLSGSEGTAQSMRFAAKATADYDH
ncbi:hypothetical protein D9611_014969 [Ephemerocybe angulata]|uniref:Uncharacterized protein n=1 Tax=Ephemerocybe angulata TaxID=980116 RepID=A0A8H5EZ50_9AGAR|nr:hypothetical protein D9611_014969 [Tulosesus angulatus]